MTLRSRVDELKKIYSAGNEYEAILIAIDALSLLDRAIMGLEGYADYADIAEKICSERGYYSGDGLSLTELPEACPTLGMLRQSRQTLADIRKQLDGDSNGG